MKLAGGSFKLATRKLYVLARLMLQWICIILQVWILVQMWRQRLYARFPLFAAYIAYVAVQTVLRSAFLANQHFYFYVYWLTAPIEVILSLLAAHESFLKVFRSFYLLWWFRIFFPGAIVVAVAYSAWKG